MRGTRPARIARSADAAAAVKPPAFGGLDRHRHRCDGGAGVPRLSRRLSPAATWGARGSPSVPCSRPVPTRDVSRVGLLVGVVRAGLSRRDEPEQPELRPERFARHAEASCRRAPMVAMLAEAGEDGGELHLADDLLERAGAVGRRCGVLDDPRGEQLRHDPLAGLGAEDETVDLVGQLAHVPGPGVALERPQRPGMEAAQRLRFRRRHALEKVDGERTDVVPALAEWREPDRKDAQTVQQVLPEGARAHGLFEVAIRRCDDPDVDLADRLATDRSHLAVLEDAEELCLDRGGRFPDLVEKERPAVRFREEAAMRPIGAAECAPDVPEERACEERFRRRGAVLGEERSASPWAVIVDRAREELLAGSGLALEQHARACLRGALGEKERVLDRGTLSDDAVQAIPFAELAPQAADFPARAAQLAPAVRRRPLELAPPEGAADDDWNRDEILAVLHDVVGRAELHRLDRELLGARPGDHDDRDLGMIAPQAAEALEAVEVRKPVVEQHAVDRMLGQVLHAGPPRARGGDLEVPARGVQRAGDQAGGARAILDH